MKEVENRLKFTHYTRSFAKIKHSLKEQTITWFTMSRQVEKNIGVTVFMYSALKFFYGDQRDRSRFLLQVTAP
jgi:hypothetical protein